MVFHRITRGATTGISDPLQMFSGRLDEHDGMRFWPPIVLTDITQFLLANAGHGDVALTNDMLEDYKVDKVYEYVLSGWLQEAYFLKTTLVEQQQELVQFIFKSRVHHHKD